MIGATVDEMRLFPDPRADAPSTEDMTRWLHGGLRTRMAAEPSDGTAAELLGHYQRRHSGTSRSSGSDVWSAIQTDGLMRLPIERIAEAQSEHRATFMYQFAWQPHHPTRDVGAFHAIDLPFAFDSFDSASATQTWAEFLGIDDDGRRLGHTIRSAWAAFAATGDPTTAETGPWAPYDVRARHGDGLRHARPAPSTTRSAPSAAGGTDSGTPTASLQPSRSEPLGSRG